MLPLSCYPTTQPCTISPSPPRHPTTQVMHSSKVYTKLQERLGLNDHLALLNVMLTKIATNLRTYGKAEELVHATLNLFQVRLAGPCAARAAGQCSIAGPEPSAPACLPAYLLLHAL